MAHCARCERPTPVEGSSDLLYWRTDADGGSLTCPQCAARSDEEPATAGSQQRRAASLQLDADDRVLEQMEKDEGWDQPPGRTPRQWPRP